MLSTPMRVLQPADATQVGHQVAQGSAVVRGQLVHQLEHLHTTSLVCTTLGRLEEPVVELNRQQWVHQLPEVLLEGPNNRGKVEAREVGPDCVLPQPECELMHTLRNPSRGIHPIQVSHRVEMG